MRRSDREVTDAKRIREIIEACEVCRLGFFDGEEVYMVPLNFGFEETEGRLRFYFHSAMEGRKLSLIRKFGRASFELDCTRGLISGEAACQYSMRYASVMGSGRVKLIEDAEEKRHALDQIMAHYTDRQQWSYPDAMLEKVAVFRLEAERLSCKERA